MTRRDLADAALTDAVVDSFTTEGRFTTVMTSLVRHLHAFASEVELTEEEWFAGIDFLTRVGHITDDKRQEFILLSDVLGLSMLVVGINNRRPPEATESTVFGPFFVEGSPGFANGDDLAKGAPGEPCLMQGRVVDRRRRAGRRARTSRSGRPTRTASTTCSTPASTTPRAAATCPPTTTGRFWFWSVKPEAYGIPDDGPVGELLQAGGRGPMRPAHVHFKVDAPGFQTLITHVFVAGDEYLDSDAVFGVRENLIGEFAHHEPGTAPDGSERDVPYWTMSYDMVLAP